MVSTSLVELPWVLAPLPLWIVFAKLLGLYDRDHRSIRHLTFDELPAIAAWAVVGTAGLALLLPLTPADPLTTGRGRGDRGHSPRRRPSRCAPARAACGGG